VEGELDGEVEGVVDGVLDGELGVPRPLHATPLNAKFTGALFVPEYVPWNPKPTVAPAATDPLYGSLVAVTC
jgi:hypothetical protein